MSAIRCKQCGYNLGGLPVRDGRSTCPECGRSQLTRPAPKSRSWGRLVIAALVGLATMVIAIVVVALIDRESIAIAGWWAGAVFATVHTAALALPAIRPRGRAPDVCDYLSVAITVFVIFIATALVATFLMIMRMGIHI